MTRGRRWFLGAVLGWFLLYVAANALYRYVDPAPYRPLIWFGLLWLSVAWYLGLGLLLLALACLVLWRRRVFRAGMPVVVVVAVAVTAYGAVAATRPSVTAYDVSSEALPPAWDGVRIALVTDLHVGPTRGEDWTREVVDLVEGQRPDLVVLGGDLVDGRERYVGPLLTPLDDLDPPLGVFAVSGNHELGTADAAAYLRRLESLGVDVLRNEHVVLERRGQPIAVAGVHDETGTGVFAPDPSAALRGVARRTFTVLVAHQPRQLVDDAGVDLQLSGHTHGGQLWPVGWLTRLRQPTLAGVDHVDGVTVVTSRGVGTSGTPARVGSPPEVTLITLRTSL